MFYRNILVTGCGGDIGNGIGRILKTEHRIKMVMGCDIHDDHPGTLVFDKCDIVPRADSTNYIDAIMNIVNREHIDVVIPTSEAELRVLSENNFFGKKSLFLTANLFALEIGLDKLATANMLKDQQLSYPWTMVAKNNKPCSLPCVLKSRTGCGSKSVHYVSEDNIEYFAKTIHGTDEIWQEYISESDGEYTAGVFRSRDCLTRVIVIKRRLMGGFTGAGIVVDNPEIKNYLMHVAKAINLNGSVNMQFRLKNGMPVIFEINPRFSSTVVFRHKLGFKDLIWSLEDRLGLKIGKYIEPKENIKIYKTFGEVIME